MEVIVIGKPEAAELLGVHPNNMKSRGKWAYGLPPSLQERGLARCASTPLWYESEIEELVSRR